MNERTVLKVETAPLLVLPSTMRLKLDITIDHYSYRHPRCVKNIQGDSGGICTTSGNDSMSDSKQKSSCEHGSDFERLRSYGHFLIPVHALM
jgi:hypothetical protein